MKKLLLCSSIAVLVSGCSTTTPNAEKSVIVKPLANPIAVSDVVKPKDVGMTPTDYNTKPVWTYSLGQFKRANPDLVKNYIIVVGTSQPVESQQFEQVAEKSAYDNAIDNLVKALGIDVEKLKTGSEVWSNETRDLVIGSFKKAMTTVMAKHRINVENDSWYGYYIKENALSDSGTQKMQSYIKKGLFTLDKARLNGGLSKDIAKEFKKKLEQRVQLNKDTQKRLANKAEELTSKMFGK